MLSQLLNGNNSTEASHCAYDRKIDEVEQFAGMEADLCGCMFTDFCKICNLQDYCKNLHLDQNKFRLRNKKYKEKTALILQPTFIALEFESGLPEKRKFEQKHTSVVPKEETSVAPKAESSVDGVCEKIIDYFDKKQSRFRAKKSRETKIMSARDTKYYFLAA